MSDILDPLVFDLVEWIARKPRPYAEVLEVWRTSCPRLPVWEAAVDQGYVKRDKAEDDAGTIIIVTAQGRAFLRQRKP
jgi:hypothetical protein